MEAEAAANRFRYLLAETQLCAPYLAVYVCCRLAMVCGVRVKPKNGEALRLASFEHLVVFSLLSN